MDPVQEQTICSNQERVKDFTCKPGRPSTLPGCSFRYNLFSHIVGNTGHIWGLDFAFRSLRDFINNVARYRGNLSPILGDARRPETYADKVLGVDAIYMDVAQPNQADIAVKNAAHFLKPGGHLLMALKSRSIDVTVSPRKIYEEQVDILRPVFEINEILELNPYEKDHAFVTATYQG